jgi:hypothetical protein
VELSGEPAVVHSRDGWLHVFGLDHDGALRHGSVAPDGVESGSWKRLGEGFTGRVTVVGPVEDSVHVFARRQRMGIGHCLVSLERGEAAVPAWEDLDAPFEGSVMAAKLEDGAVVAIGWDERDVLWYKAWERERVDPAGGDWEKLGTSEEVFAAVEWHASEKSGQERRKAVSGANARHP